jgi:hypothetical protein
MDYPRYYGNYIGIVVQNNDPQYRGRVKVFVPHISPTVYKNWIENSADKKAQDKLFKFIGSNIGSPLTDIIDDLKLILPWAETASPIAGEGSMGRYHASSAKASTSDGSNRSFNYSSNTSLYAQNSDNIAEKPGHVFDTATVNLGDAFNNPQLTNVNNVNKLSFNYTPECYSNSAKGSFAIPNVGAHVWVFFNEGDPLKPVIFASAHGAADWMSIYDATEYTPGLDYPGEYENASKSSETINADTYRNKYVINQKGGTLAFVNTDNRELLKLTHYSGSFKEFNNQASIELAVNNDQKLVLGDKFDTVRGSRNEFTQRDYDSVIAGDNYRKVGDLNVALYQKWKSLMDPVADIKQLFDIQRAVKLHPSVAGTLKLQSSLQGDRSGFPSLCPVCAGGATNLAVNDSFKPGYRAYANVATATNTSGDPVGSQNSFGEKQWGSGADAPGTGKAGAFIGNLLQNFIGGPLGQIKAGVGALIGVGGPGDFLPNRPGYPAGRFCPACGGTGASPSSFNGVWAPETKKLVDLPQKMLEIIPELAKIEAQMGLGGSEIIEITKHKIETIGTVMNDWGAVRVDPKGKMEPAYINVHPGSSLVIHKESPLIEQVQVDDLPGGTYTLNVSNRMSMLVGAGGLNMKSYGVVNISGAMTNIAGEQVNIGSANEVNIDGGQRLALVGDIVHIKQRHNEQILLDGDVGVVKNLYVKGGIYVEGKIATHELVTPQRKRQSDPIKVSSSPVPEMCTGMAIPMDSGGVVKNPLTRELTPSQGLGPPVFMGYTDQGRYTGFTPTLTQTAVLPSTIVVTGIPNTTGPVTLTVVSAVGMNPLAPCFTDTGFCVAGTGPVGLTGTLQKTPSYVPPSSPKSTPGGPDPTSAVTLRGLPPIEVAKLVAAAKEPSSGGAWQFPVMNLGVGAHADSHVSAQHTVSYDTGSHGSNAAVRVDFYTSQGKALGAQRHFSETSTLDATDLLKTS